MLLGALYCYGQSSGAGTAKAQSSAASAQIRELMVAVHINGQQASEFAVLLQDGERYYATAHELREWRLLRPSVAPLTKNGDDYYPLDALTGLTSHLDPALQILYLKVPAADFDSSILQATNEKSPQINKVEPGVFLNHDIEGTGAGGGGSAGVSGLVEAGAFSSLGVFTSRFVSRDFVQAVRPIRLDTQFFRDFPSRMSTLTIGDSVSAGNPWAEQVYYGGVRYASKFSTQPAFIPFALPSVAGEVTVPSTVDLYINGMKISQQQVDPGPFAIQNIPVMTGQGNVQMVVTDATGRQQIVTTTFNRAQILLRKGVTEYVYEAGSLRYGYGLRDSGYTSAFAAGTQRYGLSNTLTLNGRVEIQPSNQTFGGGVDYALAHVGVVSGDAAFSHNVEGDGVLGYGQFQRQTRAFGFSANIVAASSNFRQLGLLASERAARLTALAQASYSFSSRISLSGGYLRREGRSHIGIVNDPTLVDFSGINSSLNVRLTRRATLVSAINYAPGSQTRTMASLSLIIPLGPRDLMMASSQIDKSTQTATIDYSHQQPAGNGYGYRVRADAADNRGVDAGLYAQSNYGNYLIEVAQRQGLSSWRVGETGSLVWFHNKLIITRWLADSFGVVEVPESGIKVLSNNQYIASTGRRGLVVLPVLTPYVPNSIRIDDEGVPIDLQINLTEKQIVPMPRTGVYVKFSAEKAQGALLVLTTEDGKPVPLGAEVVAEGSTHEDMVALHGEAFVQDIELPGRVTVRWKDQQCKVDVPAAPDNEAVPRIGPLVCKATK
jgi:outer membrane usher protein